MTHDGGNGGPPWSRVVLSLRWEVVTWPQMQAALTHSHRGWRSRTFVRSLGPRFTHWFCDWHPSDSTNQLECYGGYPRAANLLPPWVFEPPPSGHSRGWRQHAQLHSVARGQVPYSAINSNVSFASHGGKRPHSRLRHIVVLGSNFHSRPWVYAWSVPFTSLWCRYCFGCPMVKAFGSNHYKLPNVDHDFRSYGPTHYP